MPHTDRLGKLPVTLDIREGRMASALLWADAQDLWQSAAPGRELRGALVCVALADPDLRVTVLRIAPAMDYDAARIGEGIYSVIESTGGSPREAKGVLLRCYEAARRERQAAEATAKAPTQAPAPEARPGYVYDKHGAVGVRGPVREPVTAPEAEEEGS